MADPYKGGSVIVEDSATVVLCCHGLFTKGVEQTSGFSANVLVGRDTVTRLEIILRMAM